MSTIHFSPFTCYFRRVLCVHSCFLAPATTQNLVVEFDGEICGGVLVKMLLTIFPSKEARKSPSNFAGSSPPISPKSPPTSLWKSLVLIFSAMRTPNSHDVASQGYIPIANSRNIHYSHSSVHSEWFSNRCDLRNIYHHHPESKKRKSSDRKPGSIHPYGRFGNPGQKQRKPSKTISTIAWRCGNHPHPHKMRKLRPKLRPRRIRTARVQKYCKSLQRKGNSDIMVRVSSRAKLRPWSELIAKMVMGMVTGLVNSYIAISV